MPGHYVARCEWKLLNDDPKNRMVINPCFRRQTNFNPLDDIDAQALVDDLSTALVDKVGSGELKVSLYDLQHSAASGPNYPIASKTRSVGNYIPALVPPELAVCLSFFGGQNVPRKRGRLFIPALLAGVSASSVPGYVPAGAMTSVEGFVPIFAALGGTNVDWIVWSRVGGFATKVDHYWVDNAWDIQRSRGLPPTVKVVKTTSG